eukprot:m.45486 g.45486  ORF g.45486 m.45486 type:complete len:183 (+) comp33606_c0_seq1:2-550(+)
MTAPTKAFLVHLFIFSFGGVALSAFSGHERVQKHQSNDGLEKGTVGSGRHKTHTKRYDDCLVCLRQLSTTTTFCNSTVKNDLQIMSLTYSSKRKSFVDIYKRKVDKSFQKRLMRMIFGGVKVKQADCLCSRLFDDNFTNSSKADIYFTLSISRKEPQERKRLAGKIIRNSLLASCVGSYSKS